ncbi:beta strand repeat-containing protein [Demequina capsici]|uniref:Gram-positive cocci surface proteins LPxTG domain-containing protein n=1 Tax=Demequina capsici TaxID=3075620 RepID=A0AA96J743_9MICO|nr:hypothetical protein [Demequina sp. OYTSA14]WNM24807.1 hypothetical protein RN606_01265 [Demequina sp. OYTSA14]
MRRLFATTAVAALIVGATSQVADAATSNVTTSAQLIDATSSASCSDGDTVALGASIIDAISVAVECSLTLDLKGRTLSIDTLAVAAGRTLTIDDSVGSGRLDASGLSTNSPGISVPADAELVIDGGMILAEGGYNGAGIGGASGTSGPITINGGTVTALGGSHSAGIGSSLSGVASPITINGGTVTAHAGTSGAAIGGGNLSSVSTVSITGGDVTAYGGADGTGIGGGETAFSTTILISGGTVLAVGGANAAAIGTGMSSNTSTISITGGTVTAESPGNGAAIGGGWLAYGPQLTIGAGADVTVSGTDATIGGGVDAASWGTFDLAGTLHVVEGSLTLDDAPGTSFTVASTGRLLGTVADPTVGSATSGTLLAGTGTIVNHGLIALAASEVGAGVTITDHNYLVSFDSQGGADPAPVRVFAASFDAGYRTFPTAPAGTSWMTAPDGSGQIVAADTALSSDLSLFAVTPASVLQASLASCTDGSVVSLDRDIAVTDAITIGCDVTLDLHGQRLDATAILVSGGTTFTIDDSQGGGILVADTSAGAGAAIRVESSAALVIDGGDVTALGGTYGAGIGGGDHSSAGTITINGGTVSATGGATGAGIGGGYLGDGGTVTIHGGTVTATGAGASGIGGGYGGAGADITIDAAADVTASDVSGGSAIGAGRNGTDFGSLALVGTLHVPSGDLVVADSNAVGPEVTIASSGRLLGTTSDPTTGASISGAGQIANAGVIALDESLVGVSVSGRNYLVTFSGATSTVGPVRVYAATFDAGYRTLPAPPTGDAWNTEADGSGAWLDSDTSLSADTTVYATTDAILTLTPSAGRVDQGGSLTFTVTGVDHHGNPIDTSRVVLTSSIATDVIAGLTVTFPHASPHVITATLGDASVTYLVEVTPAAAASAGGTEAAGATDALATTGANGTGPLLGALLGLLAVGIGLLAWRRRRQAA